jgi:hypothetical protein
MGLESSDRETPTATFEELQAFRAKAKELKLASLATAALVGWEWLQREEAIFTVFSVSHYRPKEHPNAVHIVHPKTDEEGWFPLFDDKGAPLYPELMTELDAIRRDRIGGLMRCRDWGDRRQWATWPQPDRPDLTHMIRKVKKIIPCGRSARRTDLYLIPAWRFHRSRGRGTHGPGDHGAGPPQVAKGAQEVRQAHHAAGRGRSEETARRANERRTIVRMSKSPLVRMAR